MFKGAFTAIVTPMHKDGSVDFDKLADHVEFQIENGIHGLVPCGTTGESATLTHEEHRQVIKFVIERAKKRVPIIAGAGSNSTNESLGLVEFAKAAGADAALVIVPYYNRPTPAGQIAHFKKVAEIGMPIVMYNVPGRTGTNMTAETTAELSRVPNIVGVKDAAGNVDQTGDIISLSREGFCVLSGDDSLTFPKMAIGGHGVISVVSNVIPKDMAALCSAALAGDMAKARELHYKTLPLMKAVFFETSPAPAKTCLSLMGRMESNMRLPMIDVQPATRAKLEAALKAYGLIK